MTYRIRISSKYLPLHLLFKTAKTVSHMLYMLVVKTIMKMMSKNVWKKIHPKAVAKVVLKVVPKFVAEAVPKVKLKVMDLSAYRNDSEAEYWRKTIFVASTRTDGSYRNCALIFLCATRFYNRLFGRHYIALTMSSDEGGDTGANISLIGLYVFSGSIEKDGESIRFRFERPRGGANVERFPETRNDLQKLPRSLNLTDGDTGSIP
ncbi:hypothetical protein BJV82DRAFT_579062 [Fennellomyces sp. T-0311]|nr:hypothetical protein BJV82DRAFT_579062 [Fennellomyces sp. T-0311]